ncbi:hypothetical protein [Microbacterium sp. NPDC058345]|uniref:hypothetical protein n=1 Tax=Microbacterium sp. NPDC058345 TaxID=3346455 RepID=UPI00365814E7
MSTRLRLLLFLVAAFAAVAVAVVSALRLLAPGVLGPFGDLSPGLVGMLAGTLPEAAIGLGGALGVMAVVLLARASDAGSAGAGSGVAGSRDAAAMDAPAVPARGGRAALKAGALLAALFVAVTTPGGMIPVAGYAFALAVLGGTGVLLVLLVMRRPLVGVVVAACLTGVVAWAVLQLDGAALLPRILAAFGPIVPEAVVALAHLGAAAALMVWVVLDGRGERGRVAAWVRHHRRAITIAAALCAVPYVVARASWLTPWPQFGGSAEMFAAEPMMQLTGLMLGTGVLAGGVLTLGLVLPWGARFPRWMAGLGGREVPMTLAVVPAILVSVLFTVGGVEFIVAVVAGPAPVGSVLEITLMLPFWLWGPLLALATWGYAMRGSGDGRGARGGGRRGVRARVSQAGGGRPNRLGFGRPRRSAQMCGDRKAHVGSGPQVADVDRLGIGIGIGIGVCLAAASASASALSSWLRRALYAFRSPWTIDRTIPGAPRQTVTPIQRSVRTRQPRVPRRASR